MGVGMMDHVVRRLLMLAAVLFAAEDAQAHLDDQICLVSTRGLGTSCDVARMADGLRCERLTDASGAMRWVSATWSDVARGAVPTIVYIHGNRVPRGLDRSQGLMVYRTLNRRADDDGPVRFIIWSWPSDHIRGPVRDYKVKAARTRQVGWQLAWALNDLPEETPLSLVGFSYGARVATGALHLLAGGDLNGLSLPVKNRGKRQPVDAAFIAAAVDAQWVRPGGFHGQALSQVDRLVLVNNRRDPAMRYYHLTFGRHVQPLGYSGLVAGRPNGPVWSFDFTEPVGRSHLLPDYLAACPQLARVWPTSPPETAVAASPGAAY